MPGDNISGYSLVSMPSDQVKPLGILSRDEKGNVYMTSATIEDLFTDSEVALPPIQPNFNLSMQVDKSLVVALSVNANLSLLQHLLSVLHLDAAFKLEKNRTVNVQLYEPKKDVVNEFKLDAYINTARLNQISPSFTEMLKDNRLYVITDILKCKKYSFSYTNAQTTDTNVGAKAPLEGEVAAGVHTDNAGTDRIINEGNDYITIGVIAYRIFYGQDDSTGKDTFRISREPIREIKGDEGIPGELLPVGQILEADKKLSDSWKLK